MPRAEAGARAKASRQIQIVTSWLLQSSRCTVSDTTELGCCTIRIILCVFSPVNMQARIAAAQARINRLMRTISLSLRAQISRRA